MITKGCIESNAFSNEDYKEHSRNVLNYISSILEKSLGYYGSTTVIQDQIYGHFITKDGFSILKKIKFSDEIASTILSIITEISRNMVREVGDGSTSSVVVAASLFNNLSKDEDLKDYPPHLIIKSLNHIEKILTEELNKKAIKINDNNFDIIKNIATVSNNNDEDCGNIIYDIYKEIKNEGFVFLENSHNEKDHYEILNGLEISRGYIDRCFANQLDKVTCSLEDPYIFLCNDTMDDTDLNFMLDNVIGPIVGQRMKPVIIVAKNYSLEFVNCWKINKTKNKDMKIVLVDYKLDNYNDLDLFDDLAIYLNATIFDKKNPIIYEKQIEEVNSNPAKIYSYLGSCKKYIGTDRYSQFIEGKSKDNAVDLRIEYLNNKIEELKLEESKRSIDNDLYKLERRKANLKAKIARLFVGGETELEKETRKYLMEDSVFACKSALKYGYIAGCNLSIPKIINKLLKEKKDSNIYAINDPMERKLLKLIENSFKDCFLKMLHDVNSDINKRIYECCIDSNSVYNLKTLEFESDNETTIINSVMTDIMIMKSAFSIIGLLVTSNQFLTSIPSVEYKY